MSTLEILGLPQSNWVWATRIFVGEKGVEHALVSAAPHSPEILAVNPLGKIPAMRHGRTQLGESRAIAAYVDRTFPGPSLAPAGPGADRVEFWLSALQTTLEPLLIRRYLFAYMFPKTADGTPDAATIRETAPVAVAHLALLEAAARQGEIGAGRFTLLDAYLIPILFYLQRPPETRAALADSPHLTRYLGAALQRASVRATMPPTM
jgi:glutathione S-transferase